MTPGVLQLSTPEGRAAESQTQRKVLFSSLSQNIVKILLIVCVGEK